MRLRTLMLMSGLVALTACGEGASFTDPLFKDVSRFPPKPLPDTRKAILADEAFAGWVIYQGEACKEHGCAE